MTILETLQGRDWDPSRGYSTWLYVRFPPCKNAPTPPHLAQMTIAAGEAFVEQYNQWPLLIQKIQRSSWWRAGPIEEEDDEGIRDS